MAASNTSDPVWVGEGEVTLDSFREQLIRQEETIIFALIERAQFPLNAPVYEKGGCETEELSLLDFMLRETERTHAKVRRFTSPDEAAFFESTYDVQPILPALAYPQSLRPNRINMNGKLRSVYQNKVLPELTSGVPERENSRTYGSTSVADIACLQALSKRIHFGKFIAEAKFRADTARYTELINANDAAGLMELLTNLAVEKKVLDRVELKAGTYGVDPQSQDTSVAKVDPKLIRRMYEELVMPITKEIQVRYLLQRVDHGVVGVAAGGGGRSAAAAHFGFSNEAAERLVLEVASAEEVFSNVMSNRVAYGVVPLESKATGLDKTTKLLLFSSTGLHISAEVHVGDTRFIVVSKAALSASGTDKVTLAFGLTDEPGALFTALGVFKKHGINLCAIESLPASPSGGAGCVSSYNFFVEFTGSKDDARVTAALAELEPSARFVRILGCYQSVAP